MVFFVKFALIALLSSVHFAILAFCSDSDSEGGSLLPFTRHPQLQRMVRDHHLQAAKAHSRRGIELSTNALKRGVDRSVDLNLLAVVDSVGCSFGDAGVKLAQSRRTSMAGFAGCLNASVASGMNTVKHLFKAHTQPKKVRTQQEHLERVRHDNNHLRQGYAGISDQIQYISEHH